MTKLAVTISYYWLDTITSNVNNEPTSQATPWTDTPFRSVVCHFQSSNSKIKSVAIKNQEAICSKHDFCHEKLKDFGKITI